MTEQARFRNRQTLHAVATATLLLTTWLASASPAAQGKGLVKSYAIENQAYTLSAQAEELSRQGNYTSALALLKQAASYDPTSYSERIHLDMAVCYQKLKNLDQAIVETKAASNFNPERSNALYMLALIYYQAERFDLCITALNSYMKVADPAGRAQAQELLVRVKSYDCAKLGTANLGTGQVKEAIKYLELASSADPSANSSCVHANLCYAYRQSGQLEKAIAEGTTLEEFRRDFDAIVARFGGTNVAAVKRIPGVSSGTLSKLRRPRIVSRWKAGTLDALARAAGVTRGDLLAGKVAP